MAKTLQLRRGTTAEITANTPASGELFVDTQKKTVTVGDGTTAGGIILARDDRVSDVFTTANGANGLAAGAFNKANTVTTGDFTFVANTITLPDFTDGVLNVTGNVGNVALVTLDTLTFDVDYGPSTPYNIFASFTENPKVLVVVTNSGTITSDDAFALELASYANTGSLLSIVGNGLPNQSLIPVTAGLVYSSTGYGGNPAWTAEIPTLARSYVTSSLAAFSVQEYEDTRVATDFEYTFSQTGEFISDSALIGDVLISDDIITPLALDSYGVVDPTQTGTLTVNGDLDVLGSVTGNNIVSLNYTLIVPGSDRADAVTNGKILSVNERYYARILGSVILPAISSLSSGDSVEVLFTGSTGNLDVFCSEAPGIGGTTINLSTQVNLLGGSVADDGGFTLARLSGVGTMKFTLIKGSATSGTWHLTY